MGKDWLGVKIENEAQRVESSNPDEQRKHKTTTNNPQVSLFTPPRLRGDNHAPHDGAMLFVLLLLAVFYRR
ncbi:hypothetical protein [Vibrio parahaemolyticus]|uniref:hypothetical protein n=1 Tax=Vibrio parahaemolyticus TaxID=670 RepID=UPI00038E3753|nr:hypothetical protein [Vibrio parahaemolyticus]EQM04937.1 hypothetical protein D045_1636 [Vibrio parahaemolyticus VP-NY4]